MYYTVTIMSFFFVGKKIVKWTRYWIKFQLILKKSFSITIYTLKENMKFPMTGFLNKRLVPSTGVVLNIY